MQQDHFSLCSKLEAENIKNEYTEYIFPEEPKIVGSCQHHTTHYCLYIPTYHNSRVIALLVTIHFTIYIAMTRHEYSFYNLHTVAMTRRYNPKFPKLTIPASAVLFLHSDQNMPDSVSHPVHIGQGGNCHHHAPYCVPSWYSNRLFGRPPPPHFMQGERYKPPTVRNKAPTIYLLREYTLSAQFICNLL